MDVREKLVELLTDNLPRIGNLPKCDNPLQYTMDEIVERIAYHLIANGVTVQEWKPISEPPKEKGTYLVCTDNGGVLLGHWYGTAWNAGGGANKHLAYWTEKPQPPKGE